MTLIRVATWNLNWMSRSLGACRRKSEFLREQPWDVLALQEVIPLQAEVFREMCVGDVVAYPGDLRGERFASALMVRNGYSLHRVSLIAELPQPRRGIWATVGGGGVEFDLASWHAPNAAKPETAR